MSYRTHKSYCNWLGLVHGSAAKLKIGDSVPLVAALMAGFSLSGRDGFQRSYAAYLPAHALANQFFAKSLLIKGADLLVRRARATPIAHAHEHRWFFETRRASRRPRSR